MPTYGTPGSAAVDLVYCAEEYGAYYLSPGDFFLFKTGIALDMRSSDMAAIIIPRSGNGTKRGLVLAHGTGLIDSDYQGELFVPLLNRGREAQTIKPGERIAQLFFIPVIHATFNVVQEFQTATARGAGGFGSTGAGNGVDGRPLSAAAVVPLDVVSKQIAIGPYAEPPLLPGLGYDPAMTFAGLSLQQGLGVGPADC